MKATKTYMSKGSIDALSLMRERERERERDSKIQKKQNSFVRLEIW